MQRYALLIGCNSGRGVAVSLLAEQDVDRVNSMLGRHCGWQIHAPLRGDVSKDLIDLAVAHIKANMCPGDFVLVYYAGHASLVRGHYSLLLPSEPYPVAALTDSFVITPEPISSMLILDACSAERAAVHALSRFLDNLRNDLERLMPAKSIPVSTTISSARIVLAASATNQKARERSAGGLFTSAFLEAAEHAGVHYKASTAGVVTLKNLKEYVGSALDARGQSLRALVYGTEPDIKTAKRWRLQQGGSESYWSVVPPILEECTHMWYSSPDPQSPVVTSYWSDHACELALGYKGEKINVLQVRYRERAVDTKLEVGLRPARRGLKLSPKGQFLAVKDETDSSVVVFDLDGTPPKRIREYSVSAWTSVSSTQFVLTARDDLVTCTSRDGNTEIALWPLGGNRAVAHGAVSGPRAPEHMRALPDGEGVITGGVVSGRALLWNLSALKAKALNPQSIESRPILPEALDSLVRPFGSVLRIAISSNGERIALAFGGLTSHVRVWSRDDLAHPITGLWYAEHTYPIQALEFSQDGTFLASGSMGGDVQITNLSTMRTEQVWRLEGESVKTVAFSRCGERHAIVIGTASGRVDVCSLDSNQTLKTLDDPRSRGEIMRLATIDDGDNPTQIVIVTPKGIEIWDYIW